MAAPWERDEPVAAQPWERDAPVDAPTEVGVVDAGVRGARGKFAGGMQRLGNIAALPFIGAEVVANQFRDKPNFDLSTFATGKFVDPWQQMSQADSIKQGENMGTGATIANVIGSIGGMLAGSPESLVPMSMAPKLAQQAITPLQQAGNLIGREFVQAQPMAQTNMIGRSNELQAQGVPAEVANAATLRSYGNVDAAGFAVPLSAAGNLLKRAATGGGAMIATGVPSTAVEGDTLKAAGYGAQAQDPLSLEDMSVQGVTGAVLAALLGQRAPRMQTAESVQAGRELAASAPSDIEANINPGAGLSIADLIQQITGAPAVRPDAPAAKQDMQARRKDAAQTLGNAPEDPVIYRRDSLDPLTGEIAPSTEAGTGTIATDPNRLVGQQQNRTDTNPVDPATAANYGEQGIDPNSIANAFTRARLGEKMDLPGEQRTVKAEFGPEDFYIISQHSGITPEEVASLGPNSQRRLLANAMEARDADAQRSTLVTSFGEEPLSSPASKPDVPGDRMPGRGEYEDTSARTGTEPPVSPEVAKAAAAKKAKMLDELDAKRQQLDKLDESETRRELKRKADMGQTMTDNERKAHASFTAQREKLAKSVFDLEGRIYDTEAKSEQGSKTATGTSDRPFKMDQPEPGSFEEAARGPAEDQARAKATAEQQAAIDRMEAEWRERNRARREEQARQEAGQRKQESDAEQKAQQKYAGKKGSTTEAPMEGGKFKADENGFVMSDTGSPLQFGHQRDAGWWILKRGNKGNTGQVFEIHNHPGGKGYTVRVTMDNGGGDGRGRSGGDGGSTGASGMGTGNLVPRSGGNRGAGAKRGGSASTGEPGRSVVQDGPVADAGKQDAALSNDTTPATPLPESAPQSVTQKAEATPGIESVSRTAMSRMEVDAMVYDADTGKFRTERTDARAALDAADADVSLYRSLLDCLGK